MSYEGSSTKTSKMLDSLNLQLREAEKRRADAERAHQEAVEQLHNAALGLSGGRPLESMETMKSRARELEKKVALETVRCEELQLELSAALKSKYSSDPVNRHQKPQIGNSGANTATITWAPAHTHSSQHHKHDLPNHHLDHQKTLSSLPTNSDNSKLGHGIMSGTVGVASEIDRIMAKIEQDNRILAELDYPRTTGSGATTTSVIGPSVYSITNAVVTSPSSHVLNNMDCTLGITGNMAPASNVADIASSTLGHVSWAGPRLTTTNAQQQINNMMPSISQSTTMPVLSLHNTYTLPSGSASYTLG
ncbi:uncharacterized protein LOC129570150, partial [Sitodiplosis mosellana]|uniref:uncharacterized protein LOC129570150 n=1 Tax=Sitodiplosis mosellana TaxID=263140 RepID=UPI00244410FF